jgi:hypothetical protein
MNEHVDFIEKVKHVERLLDKNEYMDSATRCVIVIEQALRYVINQYLDRVDEEVKCNFQDAVRKRDRRGDGVESLTMGQLVHIVRESKYFDALARVLGKDISSLRIIDFEKLTELRNKFAHHGQDASRTEAEFLLHCLKVILETCNLMIFENAKEVVTSEVERRVSVSVGAFYKERIENIEKKNYPMNNAYAVVVGIANYQNINKLPTTVIQDAKDIYNVLIDPKHCGYVKDNIQLLIDEQATRAAFRQALTRLTQCTNQDSTVFLYISSHGGRIESGPYAGEYLLPVDAVYTSEYALAQTAISGTEFTEALRGILARKVVVIFDCCHAGGIGQPKDIATSGLKVGLPEAYYSTLQAGRGRVIFASSRSTEFSWVLPGAPNSLFTQHLLAGLRGDVLGSGGVIRIFDLFHYIQPRVTADQPNQHPIFKAEIEENFPIALYLGGKAPLSTPSTLSAGDFVYDVFVSYHSENPDKTWVRKTLYPQLETEGLRVCIDYRNFRLGAPIVTEIARAVEQSRYTLAILSPRYLTSKFTELENILAEHLGLEKSQRRLLTILREDCTPRLGIRARLMLDMTDDDEFKVNLARIVHELKQSPDI